ncbi:MAG: zinc ribbon domain-containing protein [Thermoproteota archaeon]|jgi:predicted Zn-ribbon and HTH transcriptional regulator|nr:zinc ribbon domain-containing protein [Thermoproteota archaeon]
MAIPRGLMNSIMESTIKNDNIDHNNNNDNDIEISNKCPKCISGDMIEHPSFLSVPYTSRSKAAEKSKTAIEDQDADFVFKFFSCKRCGYSEFYMVGDAVRKRI